MPSQEEQRGRERAREGGKEREREGVRAGVGESPEHHGVKEGNMELQGMLRRVK